MNSLKISARRAGSVFAAAAIVLSTALPGLAAAATVTERSIALSSSSADADNVTYTVNFTATQDAGAFVVEFCSDSPLIRDACAAPGGFSAAAADSASSGVVDVTGTANKVTVELPIDVSTEDQVSVALTGINNPTLAGNLYARIVTYTNTTDAAGYTSANPDAVGAHLDDGGVAMQITPTVAVSGAVLESMTFCVAGESIADNCTKSGGGVLAAPTVKLGQDVGGVVALNSDDVYEGAIYTQISTNAANGAVLSLKNSVACGGLKRAEVATCDIAPVAAAVAFNSGDALFGVKTGAASTDADGTIQPADGSEFNSTTFKMPWTGNNTGVSSTYGSPILDTNNAPANNKNMQLTFGASAANNTPAGLYSADLSLIATGKF